MLNRKTNVIKLDDNLFTLNFSVALLEWLLERKISISNCYVI